jgi:hypothetical protein
MATNIFLQQDIYLWQIKNQIAQDESGVWWGYSVEPLRNDHGWYENEVGEYLRLGVTEPVNWTHSLLRAHIEGKI